MTLMEATVAADDPRATQRRINTLHAISSLMHRDVGAANEMLAQLGDFLRVTLQRSEDQEISLKDELEVLERYLSIMRIRFGDRPLSRTRSTPRCSKHRSRSFCCSRW